jgi:hypothetical protein
MPQQPELKQYPVYEIWTRARIVEAESLVEALELATPEACKDPDFVLSNYHVLDPGNQTLN